MYDKRLETRKRRKSIDKQKHSEFSQIICQKVQKFIADRSVIMLYNAIDGEVDVSFLHELKNKTFLYPLVVENNIVAVKSEKFKIGAYGIKEPIGDAFNDKIDAVIVPMCSYDKHLNRLGFGKGYYDRFLKDNDTLKIGVAFACQQADNIDVTETDIKMDIIITEKERLEK